MNLKSPNVITVHASNGKGEIGFVSNSNIQQKLTKVKATLATIPVGTDSMQKTSVTSKYVKVIGQKSRSKAKVKQ